MQGLTCWKWAAVIGLLMITGACCGEQVIYQDGFETNPVERGWQATTPTTRIWEAGLARTGTRSMRISLAPGKLEKWKQTCAIPVKPNVKYRMSVWVKCRNVLDHWGVNFSVTLPDGEGVGQGWICGDNGWRQYHRYFTPRTSTAISGFMLGLTASSDRDWGYDLLGTQTVWYDDLTVTETDVDMSTVPLGLEKEVRSYSNWAIGEIGDRFKLAVAAGNQQWIRAELDRAERQLVDEQFYGDGGHFEGSAHYHMATMRTTMAVMALAQANGIPLPTSFNTKLGGVITDFAIGTLTPQLRVPLTGDISSDHVGDAREMARLFSRADCSYAATGRLQGAPPAYKSIAFRDSGHYVMRTGWEPDAHYFLFRCIDHHGFWHGHFHRDQLSFLLYSYGQPVILERGDWGANARGTELHNTIMLDGKQQNHLEALRKEWVSNDDVDFVDGLHPGYNLATCRRRVFFIKSPDKSQSYWVLSDVVYGRRPTTQVKQFLHFDPAIQVSASPAADIIATNRPGKAHVVPAGHKESYIADVPVDRTPKSGLAIWLRDFQGNPYAWDVTPDQVCIAKAKPIASQTVSWTYPGSLPTGSHEVFYPFPDAASIPHDVVVGNLAANTSDADGLTVSRGNTTDYFCFALSPGARQYGGIVFDGTSAFVRTENGTPTRICIVGGKYLSVGDVTVACPAVTRLSLSRCGDAWSIVYREPSLSPKLKVAVTTPGGSQYVSPLPRK